MDMLWNHEEIVFSARNDLRHFVMSLSPEMFFVLLLPTKINFGITEGWTNCQLIKLPHSKKIGKIG